MLVGFLKTARRGIMTITFIVILRKGTLNLNIINFVQALYVYR